MTRLVVYILLSLGVAALAAWLIGLEGTVLIDIGTYRFQPRLGIAALALVLLMLAIMVAWAIIRRLLDAPTRMARATRRRRKEMGVQSLSDGFIALEAGDPKKALSLAYEAKNRLPDNAAAQLLEARAELALGQMGAARDHYRALIANPKTALAALAGLYQQAQAQGRKDVAVTFAKKAVALAPGTPWAETACFDDLTSNAQWPEALDHASRQPAHGKEERTAKKRRQAVLHTAIAQEEETANPSGAFTHAMAALKLAPDFVPAGLIAARIHINRGEVRRAQSLLRRLWRQSGHPHIALLFANAQPGASAIERLKRTRDLIGPDPEGQQAAMVLTRAAIDAYEWKTARQALAPYTSGRPTQGVCALMAEIEEGESGDQGKARQWLARAVSAPRDPVWTADGVTSDDWQPLSPISNKLDGFEWKAPGRLDRPAPQSPLPPSPIKPLEQQPTARPALPADATAAAEKSDPTPAGSAN